MRRLGFTARKKPRMVAVGLEDVTSVIEIFERMAKELYGGYTSSSMERLKQQVGIE